MLELVLIAVLLIAFCYVYGIKPLHYWKNREVRQGKPKWFAGDFWRSLLRIENFTEMTIRLYSEIPNDARYYGTYQFSTPVLIIKDPELIKQITVKDFDHFLDHRTFVPENADPLLAKNLFALKGQKWRDMRPILSPSFTSSKMKAIFILMSQCAKDFCNFFSKKNEEIIDVELKDIFTRYTNDVIATTAFGIKVNSLEDPENEFYLMGKEATDFSSFRKTFKFFGFFCCPKLFELLKISFFDANVANFFTELVENTIRTRKEKKIVRPDMIHLLMEAQKMGIQLKEDNDANECEFSTGKPTGNFKELTTLDITAQALIFFFAGFDSVATAMSFMAYELAVNPDIQNRLREEILTTFEESNGNITYELLHKMKYLDMVVSETLRKWPNAVMTDRVCTKPYMIEPVLPNEKPLLIEKGVVIGIPLVGIHRDPNIYPEPERFDPERFNDENKRKIDPYKYIPFGLGPRVCIGNRFALMEMKVISFHILLNFEIVPTSKSKIPLKLTKKQINMVPEGGFWFGLKKIKK